MTIEYFIGQYDFLSNFYFRDIVYEGIAYPTVENAFQAAKILKDTPKATNLERVRLGFVRVTPSMAKHKGGRIVLRDDWEEIKDQVMYDILKIKFTSNKDLRDRLISTGNVYILDGNSHHDNYWGQCNCEKCINEKGQNVLGKLLMRVREEIR